MPDLQIQLFGKFDVGNKTRPAAKSTKHKISKTNLLSICVT
jgi:hypothetical protein